MPTSTNSTDKRDTSEGSQRMRLIKVPMCHQETPYTCGIACIQSILAGYGIIYTQDVLSVLLKQKPIYGTDYRNMLTFMEILGFQASYDTDMTLEHLKELINNHITPILIIQAWKIDTIDYSYDWKSSHYVVTCGYDDNSFIFMDPWTIGNYTSISNEELMKRWHALDHDNNHHYRSGIIIKHNHLPYTYDPNIIKNMG